MEDNSKLRVVLKVISLGIRGNCCQFEAPFPPPNVVFGLHVALVKVLDLNLIKH
jgi:hypothetical protein